MAHTPLAFFKFAVKASLNAALFGVGGDFVVEVLPSMARDFWGYWAGARPEEELRPEVQAVAQLGDAEVRQLAQQAVAEEAAAQPEAVRQQLSSYLAQVPAAIRQTQRRPADRSGRTLAPGLSLRASNDLLGLLPPRPRSHRFQAGQRAPGFTDWVLEEPLGVGGFGEVWKATNPHLPPRALKYCLSASAARGLVNEAKLLAQVRREGERCPGIVRLLDTSLQHEHPCLAYEYVAGGDLAGLVREWQRQPPPDRAERAGRTLLALTEVVGFAHRLSPAVVHRDLKPANVLLQPDGRGGFSPRVADFGIGGLAAQHALRETGGGSTGGPFLVSGLRGSCTALYASPQQLRGDDPDPRDDVHALGVIWLQLLTGDLTAGRPSGSRWPQRLKDQGVGAGLLDLLGSCVEDDPADRPPDAAALAERLTALLGGPEPGRVRVDPLTARVQEYPVAPLRVEVARVAPRAQPHIPEMPPLPGDVVELESRLEGLAAAVEQLEAETHPALTPAREAVAAAERQWQQFGQDLEAHPPPLGADQLRPLTQLVGRDPRTRLSDLVKLVPWDDHHQAMELACRVRNQELARRALDSARQEYDRLRREQVDALRREGGEMENTLRARQLADFPTVLQGFFDRVNHTDGFPEEEWLRFAPRLQQRRHRLSPLELLEKAEDAWEEWREHRVVTLAPKVVINTIGMKLALVPAGTFIMGSPAEEAGRNANEGPQHEVEISRPFYLGVYPVTQEQWQRVMGSNPSHFCSGGDGKHKVRRQDPRNFPVERVSWEDAVAFCRKLSELPEEKQKRRVYRLPTEAEWEYACRGGASSSTPFYYGTSLSSTQANFDGNYSECGAAKGPYLKRTTEVGAYKVSNGFGLYDLHGNVWEWCADWYDEHYYASSPRNDPPGAREGSRRVVRGGGWDHFGGLDCRSAYRGRRTPGIRRRNLGVRVALVPSGG